MSKASLKNIESQGIVGIGSPLAFISMFTFGLICKVIAPVAFVVDRVTTIFLFQNKISDLAHTFPPLACEV